jgi:hypothetical protein
LKDGSVKKLRTFSDGGWMLEVGGKNIVKNLCICHIERAERVEISKQLILLCKI